MQATFVVYMAALLSFLGWFLFSAFAGVGLISLPLAGFNTFKHRPKVLRPAEAEKQRKALATRAMELVAIGEAMAERILDRAGAKAPPTTSSSSSSSSSSSAGGGGGRVGILAMMSTRKQRREAAKNDAVELARFRVLVDALEADLEVFRLCDPASFRSLYNPFLPYLSLVGGVFALALTLAWAIHIILFMLFTPPLHPGLNALLLKIEAAGPIAAPLAPAILSLLALYLLFATAHGALKVGSRLFLIKVHPLVPGGTLMNSLFFNIGLVVICVLPVTQLLTDAFSQFGRSSDAAVVFGTQFRYMEGISVFWKYNVFLFTILGFTLLSLVYFSVFPSEKAHLRRVVEGIKKSHEREKREVEAAIGRRGGALEGLKVKVVAGGGGRKGVQY